MSSAKALVVSGDGRLGDPWHRFAETSASLAAALSDRGYAVEVCDDADTRLAALATEPPPSLLIVNIGGKEADRFAEPAVEGLVAALHRGLPTLLVHSTLTAFPDWALWREITGGGWIQGTTYHPSYGPGVALADPEHPLTVGLDQLAITDERYTRLWLDKTSRVFLRHEEDGQRHPLGWTRSWGRSPIVVDALGHDVGAYRATGRVRLLQRELDWLQEQEAPAPSS
jgi:type 1 glutamine amidotransferase